MSKQNDALKLALEALELVNIEFVCDGAHHAKKDRHELGDDCPVTARYQNAITAIKKALAQPEQEPLTWQQLQEIWIATPSEDAWIDRVWEFARAVEAAHGIKG